MALLGDWDVSSGRVTGTAAIQGVAVGGGKRNGKPMGKLALTLGPRKCKRPEASAAV